MLDYYSHTGKDRKVFPGWYRLYLAHISRSPTLLSFLRLLYVINLDSIYIYIYDILMIVGWIYLVPFYSSSQS